MLYKSDKYVVRSVQWDSYQQSHKGVKADVFERAERRKPSQRGELGS